MPNTTEYFEVAPKRSGAVPLQWKVLQTMVFGITSVSGYACAIIFGYWLQGLDAHCPLYAEFQFIVGHNGSGLQLDFSASKWGKDPLCSYCQFVPILSAVYAFIWGGFFACCGRGGRSSDGVEPWKLVFAALVFSTLYLPITLTASVFTTSGIASTCENLSEYLRQISYFEEADTVCTGEDLTGLGIPISSNLLFLQIMAWLSSGGWVISGLLLLLRYLCLADWDLVKPDSDRTKICEASGVEDQKERELTEQG